MCCGGLGPSLWPKLGLRVGWYGRVVKGSVAEFQVWVAGEEVVVVVAVVGEGCVCMGEVYS